MWASRVGALVPARAGKGRGLGVLYANVLVFLVRIPGGSVISVNHLNSARLDHRLASFLVLHSRAVQKLQTGLFLNTNPALSGENAPNGSQEKKRNIGNQIALPALYVGSISPRVVAFF